MESDAFGRLRAGLGDAIRGTGTALAGADRLCEACVEFLDVDGAAISVLDAGSTRGTFGSSGALSRHLDELQFTYGEGPCLDAVEQGRPVLVEDLGSPSERRWPAFTEAVLRDGVGAVFALPVALASSHVGALDLFRFRGGPLSELSLQGGLLAARLAAVPLLDLMTDVELWSDEDAADGWRVLAGLERVEVYQATGMLIDRLGLAPVDALARLRAHAYAHGLTASATAWAIIHRRLVLTDDDAAPPDTTGPVR